jgi:hypothetical protein
MELQSDVWGPVFVSSIMVYEMEADTFPEKLDCDVILPHGCLRALQTGYGTVQERI